MSKIIQPVAVVKLVPVRAPVCLCIIIIKTHTHPGREGVMGKRRGKREALGLGPRGRSVI